MARTKITNSQLNFTQGSGSIKIGTLLIQWGTLTTASIGTAALSEVNGTVTYPTAYSAAPVVTISMTDLPGACGEYVAINPPTATSFGYFCGHSQTSAGASTSTLQWIAIGLA